MRVFSAQRVFDIGDDWRAMTESPPGVNGGQEPRDSGDSARFVT
jgi:hypothetical protein